MASNNNMPDVQPSKNNLNNICRVVKESHIDQILTSNRNVIIMVLFCFGEQKIKAFLKRIAKDFSMCHFVLACIDDPRLNKKEFNFETDRRTYMNEIKNIAEIPYIFFFYDTKLIGRIKAAEPRIIIDTLSDFVNMLQNSNQNNPNNLNQPNTNPNGSSNQNNPNQNQNQNQNQNGDPIMKMAREYQVEKMTENKQLHELNEYEKLRKLKKKMNKNNNVSENSYHSESGSDDDQNADDESDDDNQRTITVVKKSNKSKSDKVDKVEKSDKTDKADKKKKHSKK
ncbi:MAG: hypothetical protein Terrestrivirus3_24 [Terrestrivirus sp.]|uniref:Thioredoxin-like protein n=1 Tax=Terrestrivirus sp. TaxID=2487775 RepID=A0A3G4ZLN9_9VIRU|nr:MAG: hypothetical protein Terrestrivirus3_24 [Terrestrivirus sp.]